LNKEGTEKKNQTNKLNTEKTTAKKKQMRKNWGVTLESHIVHAQGKVKGGKKTEC